MCCRRVLIFGHPNYKYHTTVRKTNLYGGFTFTPARLLLRERVYNYYVQNQNNHNHNNNNQTNNTNTNTDNQHARNANINTFINDEDSPINPNAVDDYSEQLINNDDTIILKDIINNNTTIP